MRMEGGDVPVLCWLGALSSRDVVGEGLVDSTIYLVRTRLRARFDWAQMPARWEAGIS